MKTLIISVLLLLPLAAEETPPAPTVDQQLVTAKAEIESLKQQMAEMQMRSAFEMHLCNATLTAAREFVVGRPAQRPQPAPRPPASTQPAQ